MQLLISQDNRALGDSLPRYATPGSAGMDLRASIATPVTLYPAWWASIPLVSRFFSRLRNPATLIPLGFRIAVPVGYEAQIRSRSGLTLKHGITVLNSPGTVDSDYRGPVSVILINHGARPYTVTPGERIAQMVITSAPRCTIVLTDSLDSTDRDAGGFGSTGTH